MNEPAQQRLVSMSTDDRGLSMDDLHRWSSLCYLYFMAEEKGLTKPDLEGHQSRMN